MPTFDYGVANLDRIGDHHCHPSNAVRTKCRCGRVLSLGRSDERKDVLGPPMVNCECGRVHRKASGGWRGANNGGRNSDRRGCCGLHPTDADKAQQEQERLAVMKYIRERTREIRRTERLIRKREKARRSAPS